jgi:tetratricopeptide (TPR) repeat protein
MAWEEEIDLSLLEEEGMSIFKDDDARKGKTALPGALESAEELLKQNGIDFPTLKIVGIKETGFFETKHRWESEPEETLCQDAAFDAGGTSFESADLITINMQIEGLRRTPKVRLPDLAQTGPIDVGVADNVTEKESAGIPLVKKRKKYDLDGQLNEFKKVLDDQIDKNDTETHYSLGIAYKEMCLFDDAINEFQTASQDPQRRIDCLTLEGVCYRDKGDYAKAEEILNNTLTMQGLTGAEIVSLRYELAILFETVGRQKDALQLYRQVQSDNPGYRDATKKIVLLHGGDDVPGQDEMELLELDVEELE